MSEANVDFVRNLFEGAAGMDKEALLAILPAAVAQAFTEDAVWMEDPSRADQQVWRGHDGICAASRAEVSATNHYVLTLRDSKISRYQEFYDESAARAVLG